MCLGITANKKRTTHHKLQTFFTLNPEVWFMVSTHPLLATPHWGSSLCLDSEVASRSKLWNYPQALEILITKLALAKSIESSPTS